MAALEDDIQRARDRFAAWLRWYLATHPKEAESQNELARRLGTAGATLTYLLERGSTRTPSFKTLLAARKLTEMPIDVLLFGDPPSSPKK